MEDIKLIPQSEYDERIHKVQAELQRRGLDGLFPFGSEAEPQFVRYFSDYWPAFESAGVLIPAEGQALLLIGPESLTYAQVRTKIPEIRQDFWQNVRVLASGEELNQSLEKAGRVVDFLELAELVKDIVARNENGPVPGPPCKLPVPGKQDPALPLG